MRWLRTDGRGTEAMGDYPGTIEVADRPELAPGDDGVKVLMEPGLHPVRQAPASAQRRADPGPTDRSARYPRREQARVWTLRERVVHGGSTRKDPAIRAALCGTARSTRTVSGRYQRLDPIVPAWRTRNP